MINTQIFITSVNKAINRSRSTGMLNLLILQLVDIFIYYIELTDKLISLGLNFKEENKQLKSELHKLRSKYPHIICNYKNVLPISNTVSTIPPVTNTPPTVDDNTVDVTDYAEEFGYYKFSVGDFTVNYADAENHSWKYLMIIPNSNTTDDGELYLQDITEETLITDPIIIDIENINPNYVCGLVYKMNDPDVQFTDTFTFRVSDNPADFLYSSIHTMTVLSNYVTNQPPVIGDITINSENRESKVLTLDMFTTLLSPPYNDPENDLIDAIRFTEISDSNLGSFHFDGAPVELLQVITREDLQNGLLRHIAANTDEASSDVFTFEARDEGSQTWVE